MLPMISACGAGGDDGSNGYTGDSVQVEGVEDTAEEVAAPPEEPTAATLSVAGGSRLGDVVVDAGGYTLYRFDEDTTDPPTSACEGECAEQWPPATAEGEISAEGVELALVDRIQREDGAWQLTLGGWPLYRYVGDNAPGDVNGHGTSQAWFAVTSSGERAEEAVGSDQQDGGDTAEQGTSEGDGEAVPGTEQDGGYGDS